MTLWKQNANKMYNLKGARNIVIQNCDPQNELPLFQPNTPDRLFYECKISIPASEHAL